MTETHITLRIPRLRFILARVTGRHRRDAERQELIQQALAQGFAAGVAFMKDGAPRFVPEFDGGAEVVGYHACGRPMHAQPDEPPGVDPVHHEISHVVANAAGRAAVGVFLAALASPSLLLAASSPLWAF